MSFTEFGLHGFAIIFSCGIGWSKAKEEDLDGEKGEQERVGGKVRSGRGGRGGNLGRGGNIGSENAGGLRSPPTGCWNDGSVGNKGLGTVLVLGFENSGANEGGSVGTLFLCSNKRLANEIWMLVKSSTRPKMSGWRLMKLKAILWCLSSCKCQWNWAL